MIARLRVAIANAIGLDGYIRIHVDELAEWREIAVAWREGVERSARAGRTTKTVGAMSNLAGKKLIARIDCYLVPPAVDHLADEGDAA